MTLFWVVNREEELRVLRERLRSGRFSDPYSVDSFLAIPCMIRRLLLTTVDSLARAASGEASFLASASVATPSH